MPSLTRPRAGAVTFGLVGYLFLVELVSGILQGYYVPLIPDLVEHLGIRDADFNWFEAGQLLLSAIVVPVLAKLGDMVGHKRILLVSTVLTAGASWWLAFTGDFTTFLIAWALQGFYVVWLPLEVALIFDRGRTTGTAASQTRRAAGYLVVALETGAILGALGSGRMFAALGGDVQTTLMVPALAVSAVFFAILFGVPESTPLPGRTLDWVGFTVLTLALLLITSGLTFLRINGPGTWWVYALMLAGVAAFVPWSRFESRQKDPAIDLRVLRQPSMWPVQLTAGLVGISILGAQAPLSTFAGTDPVNGYGLGMPADEISYIIGAYLVSMIVGALILPRLSGWTSPRVALIVASLLRRDRIPAVPRQPHDGRRRLREHGDRGPRLGSARRCAPRRGRRGRAPRADGHRDGAHQHDEDDRRIVRLCGVRDRARSGSGQRGHRDRVEPVRLPDGVRDLRRQRACRRGSAVPRSKARVRRQRGRPIRSGRYERGRNAPLMSLCWAACATGRTVSCSMLTWCGSSSAATIVSATSSARSGSCTPS